MISPGLPSSSPAAVTSWAKLISQDPDQKDILLSTKPNEPKSFEMKGKWKIYQSAETSIIRIVNLSASKITIDFTWLEPNEEQMLFGGEITLNWNESKKCGYCYVFILMKESKNDTKRPRSNQEPATSAQRKWPKVQEEEEDLREELACSICQETLYNPVTVSPCGHRFCSGCLSENLNYSTTCPICRREIRSFRKDPLLNALTKQATKTCKSLQRPKEDCINLDEKDLISKGFQILRNEDGVYFGQCLNGKKDGEGRMIYEDGGIYQGMWKEDQRFGRGKLTLPGGDIYEATWIDDVRTYFPVEITFSNGAFYVGKTQDLLMHEKGVLTFQSGDQYRGEFVRDKIEGYGTYLWQNGDKYTGYFVDQTKHGYGIMEYANGNVYEGDWKNNMKDGEGTFKYGHGLEFEGKWKYDISVGKGKFICGKYVFEGKWEKA